MSLILESGPVRDRRHDHASMMNHSFEEIRAAVLDILAGREKNYRLETNPYNHWSIAVAELFARREKGAVTHSASTSARQLSSVDGELFS